MLRQRIDLEEGPEVRFESVGVNRATVFTGLCAKHDSSVFRSIESEDFDIRSAESLFLLAYRAVLRETHFCIEAAARIQSAYLKQCALGLVNPDIPTRGGMMAVERMVIAYETWLYKQAIDEALLRCDFSAIVHDVLDLGPTGPCIAVSSLFSLDDVPIDDDVARVAPTVLPTAAGRTYAVLSYTAAEAAQARDRLRSALRGSSASLRYQLSRLILERCENVVISPSHFVRLGPEQAETIRQFFAATILVNEPEFEHDHLNLFDVA